MTKPNDEDRRITAVSADGSLYPIGKLTAHQKGALHLAISVFLFAPDATGRDTLLIQRRATGKYHSGGLWANTCCSHPDWQEDISAAAARRLHEELGVKTPLTQTAVIEYRAAVGAGLVEHERVHVFLGRLPSQTRPISPDPQEVSELRWSSVSDLRLEAREAPERFAPWLRIYLDRWAELGLD